MFRNKLPTLKFRWINKKEIEEYKKIEKEGFAKQDKVEHLEKIISIKAKKMLTRKSSQKSKRKN